MRPMKKNAYIASTGIFLPENIVTNEMLAKIVDTSDEWIQERCGIKERRILNEPGKATAYMASLAAKNALEESGIDKQSIGTIIVATATPDHQFPSTASIVSGLLNIRNVWCFDVMSACSGFLYALNAGAAIIESGRSDTVLVIGADKMSSIIDFDNRNTCVLFGDGAGAVLLKSTLTGEGIGESVLETDGSGYKNLFLKSGGSLFPASEISIRNKEHFIFMNGQSVFKSAVASMVSCNEKLLKKTGLMKSDIDYLIPHQANKRIIEAVIDFFKISREKVAVNIQNYGNTTCASIPICLHEYKHRFKKGDKLVLCSFGAGYSWGSTLVTWN